MTSEENLQRCARKSEILIACLCDATALNSQPRLVFKIKRQIFFSFYFFRFKLTKKQCRKYCSADLLMFGEMRECLLESASVSEKRLLESNFRLRLNLFCCLAHHVDQEFSFMRVSKLRRNAEEYFPEPQQP